MNVEYIKDYKYKELKQYVLAYLLITVASVGLYAKNTIEAAGLLPTLFSMIAIDTLAGAICALVFVLNELWSDKSKRRIVYKNMPSDTVFSDIYAKIAWFCTKKNIDYEEETLSKAVKIRNALAHGDNVNISFSSREYKLIANLSHQFIHEKFFSNIKKCFLEGRIID